MSLTVRRAPHQILRNGTMTSVVAVEANGEVETYINSSSNVFQDGKGNLVIRAFRDSSVFRPARPAQPTLRIGAGSTAESRRGSSGLLDRVLGPPSGCWVRT